MRLVRRFNTNNLTEVNATGKRTLTICTYTKVAYNNVLTLLPVCVPINTALPPLTLTNFRDTF
jgi:hypothetical protein